MKRIISAMMAALLMLATLTTTANAAKKVNSNDVRYTELRNYFHNNDAPMPASPMITTQKEFEAQFGMAAYMGKGGQPTPVNFKKQVVLAIVLPVTNAETDIDSVSVKQTGANELTLAYTVHNGLDMGYSIQPVYLLSIDKKYKKYNVKVDAKTIKDINASKTSYEFVSYNDDRNHLYLNIDYPTKGNEKVVKAVRNWMSEQLGSMANSFSLTDSANRKEIVKLTDADFRTFMQTYVGIVVDSMKVLSSVNAKFGSPNPCSLNANIARVYEDGNVVSFESNGYNYTGGAHGISFCYGATFDKATGKQLNLVKDSEALRKLVTERLHKNWNMQGLHFEKEPVPMPQATPYVVGDGKIKFIYQPYEIGAYALGKPECEFYPYEIEDCLTADGKMIEK